MQANVFLPDHPYFLFELQWTRVLKDFMQKKQIIELIRLTLSRISASTILVR